MKYCNICKNKSYRCSCKSNLIKNVIVNSDQSGRDGLSSYDIAILTGKFYGTESEFVEWNRGPKGDKGDSGVSVYENTEW